MSCSREALWVKAKTTGAQCFVGGTALSAPGDGSKLLHEPKRHFDGALVRFQDLPANFFRTEGIQNTDGLGRAESQVPMPATPPPLSPWFWGAHRVPTQTPGQSA